MFRSEEIHVIETRKDLLYSVSRCILCCWGIAVGEILALYRLFGKGESFCQEAWDSEDREHLEKMLGSAAVVYMELSVSPAIKLPISHEAFAEAGVPIPEESEGVIWRVGSPIEYLQVALRCLQLAMNIRQGFPARWIRVSDLQRRGDSETH